MNGDDFDALIQSFDQSASRRLLLGGALLGALGHVGIGEAKRKHKHKKKKKKHHNNRNPTPNCVTPCTSTICGTFPAGCPLLPADSIWNTPVNTLAPDGKSADYITSIGRDTGLKADFGAGLYDGGPIGIPFAYVGNGQAGVSVSFQYANESDPGPYPIPSDAPIEGGTCSSGDRHILIVNADTCVLYEVYNATPQGSGWHAGSGAIFDLRSNALRPAGWTSADAAGLPILPGLVRYEEVAAGVINHALRFTADVTRTEYVWPARHQAGSTSSSNAPPMGQRFRLNAGFDISGFSTTNKVILTALKTYGMFLADNGSDWFLSGVPDDRWDNDDLRQLQDGVHGRDFEAVDCSSLMADPNSGQGARRTANGRTTVRDDVALGYDR